MSSYINPNNIDQAFPVAGQDNSSQGFRDNFTNIKNNFTFAKNEIEDLQSKSILTGALTGQTLSNDMAGTQITRPQLKAWTQAIRDLGAVSSTASLDFLQGNFQKITTAGAINLSLTNWPVSSGGAFGYGTLRLWLVISDPGHTMTLPTSVSIGVGDIAGYDIDSHTIAFDAPGNYIFDFSSSDNGTTYFISDQSRNSASFRDPSIYYNPDVNGTFMIGYGSGLSVALALEQGQDIVSAYGSYNSACISDLSTANVQSGATSTTPLAGYSVTAARGNIMTSTVDPVSSGDILGYFNAATYTGISNTGNTFQQTSSIVHYAVGANVTYGLGGNIAFYTKPDGQQDLVQAMSIANDQTVEVLGSFKTDGNIIERGTYVKSFATSGDSFTANGAISTLIVDSINSAAITAGTIVLPPNPVEGQRFKISAVAPITTANVFAPGLGTGAPGNVRYTPSNTFSSGNVIVAFTFHNSVWYRS